MSAAAAASGLGRLHRAPNHCAAAAHNSLPLLQTRRHKECRNIACRSRQPYEPEASGHDAPVLSNGLQDQQPGQQPGQQQRLPPFTNGYASASLQVRANIINNCHYTEGSTSWSEGFGVVDRVGGCSAAVMPCCILRELVLVALRCVHPNSGYLGCCDSPHAPVSVGGLRVQ